MILTETPRRIMVTKLVNWGHWFALSNILIAIIIASVYVFTAPLPDTLLGLTFLFTNWLSHVGFLTFFGFVIFVLPLCYIIPNARVVKATSSTIAALGLALLAFDALLYTKYGLHLSFSSAELIRSEAQTVISKFGWRQWGYLFLLFIVWLSFQLILANALWKRLERLQKFHLGMPISSFFVACFMLSHAMHVWADANLYQPIIQQDDLFPLSYPATAKTLMGKYGLLDLESYKQRKAIQFDSRINTIKYPSSPVYCSINTDKSIVILVQRDATALPADAMANMTSYPDHYDLGSSSESAVLSTLYGLPELYLSALHEQTPLVLDLPSKLNLPVKLFSNEPIEHVKINEFVESWTPFYEFVTSAQPKLAVGFVSAKQLKTLLASDLLTNNNVIVTQLTKQRSEIKSVPLYANFELASTLSSHVDLMPTAINLLGCSANTDLYTTGQNLLNPRRNWLVGTQGSKVIVLHNDQRTEVLSNGNYKIYERQSGEESAEPLNTGLLSQAIKHLSRFAQ